MVRRCVSCKLKKNYKTLCLQCRVCDDFYHRTCLNFNLETFYSVRDKWECQSCTVNFVGSKCIDCGSEDVYIKKSAVPVGGTAPDWYCMNCLFPPMAVHDIFNPSIIEYDPINIEGNVGSVIQDKPTLHKGLKLGHLNIRKLDKYIDQLRLILDTYKFDVFACSETFLDESVPDGFVSIAGYRMLRIDRVREGGGLIIYIAEKYMYSAIDNLVKLPIDVELQSFQFWCTHIKPIVFTVVYKPPHINTEDFSEPFDSIVNTLRTEFDEIFILGDFNIDLRKKTAPVNRFKFQTRSCGLVQLIKSTTRVNVRSSS
jgi:hypothetical protein